MQSGLQAELDMLPVRDVEAKARSILAGLGFADTRLGSRVSTLSGGWRMRCQLAAALLQTADVLILDEPTNFLDMLGMLWLQRYLEDLRDSSPDTAVVLVSHDRDFVNATCDELMILREKRLSYFQGNLESYEKSMRHEIVRMSRMKEAQDRQIAHMSKTIANSVQQGKKTGDDNKLRQAKSRQKKLDDRMGMEVSSKGGRFKLNRDLAGYHYNKRDTIEVPKDEEVVSLRFPSAPEMRFQSSLISLEGVSYRYPRTVKPALQDVNIIVHPGDRIGLLGLNGAGKTTLVQLLTGTRIPTSGTLQAYPRLKVGFYSQHTVDDLAKRGSADTNFRSYC
jgi:ATPase subunit of ABC transporter with duplicated ATPase domains